MIAIEQMRAVAEDLLRQTQTKQVRWLPDASSDTGRALFFPTSHIRISGWEEEEPQQHRLAFEDEQWNVVGEWIVRPGEQGWDLLHDLHEAAWASSSSAQGRQYSRVTVPERVLKDIQAALRGKEQVGT